MTFQSYKIDRYELKTDVMPEREATITNRNMLLYRNIAWLSMFH